MTVYSTKPHPLKLCNTLRGAAYGGQRSKSLRACEGQGLSSTHIQQAPHSSFLQNNEGSRHSIVISMQYCPSTINSGWHDEVHSTPWPHRNPGSKETLATWKPGHKKTLATLKLWPCGNPGDMEPWPCGNPGHMKTLPC